MELGCTRIEKKIIDHTLRAIQHKCKNKKYVADTGYRFVRNLSCSTSKPMF
jgi:hypothetical protein